MAHPHVSLLAARPGSEHRPELIAHVAGVGEDLRHLDLSVQRLPGGALGDAHVILAFHRGLGGGGSAQAQGQQQGQEPAGGLLLLVVGVGEGRLVHQVSHPGALDCREQPAQGGHTEQFPVAVDDGQGVDRLHVIGDGAQLLQRLPGGHVRVDDRQLR